MKKAKKKLKFETPEMVSLKGDIKAAGECVEGSHPESHADDTSTCFDGQGASGGDGCGIGHKNYLS